MEISVSETLWHKIQRAVVPMLWALAMLGVILIYQKITTASADIASQQLFTWLMLATLLTIAALAFLYAQKIYRTFDILKERAEETALKKRMMIAFGVVTIMPTLFVSIFAFSLFNLGLQAWFDKKVQTGLTNSLAVAEAYFNEHKENLRADALSLAQDISKAGALSFSNPIDFNNFVNAQAEKRSLTEVIVSRDNRLIAQGKFSFALVFEKFPPNYTERAKAGEVVIFTDDSKNKVRALTRVEGMPDTYMIVGRLVDGRVLSHMQETQGAYREYMEQLDNLGDIQFNVSLVFLAFALLLLLGALWYALQFATKLTDPISRLAFASERIRGGDYSARVAITDEKAVDEIDKLSLAFNRMADQLEAQRADLITANRNLDERRRFSEAVLSGVSSGVVALNKHFEISLANRSAEKLLLDEGHKFDELVGCKLEDVMPDMHQLLADLAKNPAKQVYGNITYERGEERLTLHARITSETLNDTIFGYIATFDDITPLISAQRQAAWSDVARRIAHEIKNPLTPITLAAERLKRKYMETVADEEKENFKRYTETIEHHAGNIGRMVEEFVQFARIPTPEFADVDVESLIKKALFTEKVAHSDITYHAQLAEEKIIIAGDERLLSQLLVNLLKNAAEAMQDVVGEKEITVKTKVKEGRVTLTIADTGKGIDEEFIEKIFEPYVTTRAKGTGLGLAISKKIVEDHKGSIKITNRKEGGALVTLSFPIK